MSPEEIAAIVRMGANFGIWKIKLTGGEPLVRSDISVIVSGITRIPRIRQVSLVTNGALLRERAQEVKNAGLDFVAVSLPTLDTDKYRMITGVDCLSDVLEGIKTAHRIGLQIVLNVVLLKGLNVPDIAGIVDFAGTVDAIIKFIELLIMPEDAGPLQKYYYDPGLLARDLQRISLSSNGWSTGGRPKAHSHFNLRNGVEAMITRYPCNSRSCNQCSEVYDGLRLTSDGRLASCILRDDNYVDILSLIKRGSSDKDLEDAFLSAMTQIGKPPSRELTCNEG